MMELTMNGQIYSFKFGLGFLLEMNKKVLVPVDNIPSKKREAGFRYCLAEFLDGEVPALIEILKTANTGQDLRVTDAILCDYIDNECEDIDALFETVKDFLSKANATKKDVKKMIDAIEEEKATAKALQEALEAQVQTAQQKTT